MTLEQLVKQYAESLYHYVGGIYQTPEQHAENLELIIDLFNGFYPEATTEQE